MTSILAFIALSYIPLIASSQSIWNCGEQESFIQAIQNKYGKASKQIRDHLLNGFGRGEALGRLQVLTDTFGPRIVGSQALENAIDYLANTLKNEGFATSTEPFQTYNWVRGKETATLLSPRIHPMAILGLGSTVPTPDGGIEADAIVVRSFAELDGRQREARGKIVVFNQPWISYDQSSEYRVSGASYAANYGAVATLIRSPTPFSIYSPHTGMQAYASGATQIPTACITVEDAEFLSRLQARELPLRIHLEIKSQIVDANYTTRNVIIDYRGYKYPNEIVLIGGHVDSWDVGSGAEDDGSGVITAWEALTVLRRLGLQPKRTIRAIFWNAEEQGHVGSRKYYQAHKNDQYERYVFVAESDAGAMRPSGLNFTAPNATAKATMAAVLKLLKPINASLMYDVPGDIGDPDGWVRDQNVPGAWLENSDFNSYYMNFHHSNGDSTLIYENEQHKQDLDLSSILWATISYVLADLEADTCAVNSYIDQLSLENAENSLTQH